MSSPLGISLGSIVSIVISHSSSFLGFAEESYDGAATLILVAEIAAVVLVLLAAATGALKGPATADAGVTA